MFVRGKRAGLIVNCTCSAKGFDKLQPSWLKKICKYLFLNKRKTDCWFLGGLMDKDEHNTWHDLKQMAVDLVSCYLKEFCFFRNVKNLKAAMTSKTALLPWFCVNKMRWWHARDVATTVATPVAVLLDKKSAIAAVGTIIYPSMWKAKTFLL